MSRRRPVTRTREKIASMFHNAMEDLEPRTLLHTLTGSGVFEYKDAEDQIVRVRYHNIQAELVFGRVNEFTNELVLSEPTFSFQGEEDGKDLFHLYIAQAGPGAYITAAEVPPITANVRPMQPFTGNVQLTVFGSRGGLQAVSTAGGSGGIYLGAKTRDTPANILLEPDRPFLSDQFFGMGILGPRPNGRLTAGIHAEAGVDLDRFFWGGVISGQVDFGGSVDTLYAGGLLTGDTSGEGPGQVSLEDNFRVRGDLRELIVRGSIGTHDDSQEGLPVYQSGFDLQVDGTIGRVQSYNHILGNIRADNDPAAPRLRSSQREIEAKVLPGNRGSLTHFEGNDTRDLDFDDLIDLENPPPRLGDNQAEFSNDTLENAQFLGSFNSSKVGAGSIVLNGRLQNIPQILDNVDFYAIPLLGGQTINIRLLAPETFLNIENPLLTEDVAAASITVFDPDGRAVGSDTNNVLPESTLNKYFQFTADRPGVYRLSINVGGFIGNLLANIDYQLQIQKVGLMSIGSIISSGEIYGEVGQRTQIHAAGGDLGVLFAGETLAYAGALNPFDPPDIFVDGGNLRVVDAAQIGFAQNQNGFGPNFEVFGGDIGHIRGRTGLVNLETVFIRDNVAGVGGSAQLIEAPTSSLFMELHADKRLGVARANNMATVNASVIDVNYDKRGADGVIDLIDVDLDLGTLASGGPQITTGPGGNVRYIHVDGTTFRDVLFGSGAPDIVEYEPGQEVSFIDDSGTPLIIRPNPDRTFDPVTGLPLFPGTLNITRYPIRDKGGLVMVNLTSTEGVEVIAGGQQGTRGTAEIGEINANGIGALIVEDTGNLANTSEDDELELDRNADGTLDELEVVLNGSAGIDVYEIVGGSFTQIINGTAGEIVNVTANSIGEIEAATLGLAKSHTGTAVGGNTILNTTPTQVGPTPDAGPFTNQRIGIVVAGDIVSARSRQGLGNFIVDGSIQELSANADGVGTKGVHEGINAPIMTRPGGVATAGGGEIRFVQIGEGILHSGTGSVSFSGIFAYSRIGTIKNQGEGSDIRGDIVSKGQNLPTFQRRLSETTVEIVPLEPIGSIDLDDGAIIEADILVVQRFQSAWELAPGPDIAPDSGTFSGRKTNEIGFISLEGKGGIMSSSVRAADIGNIEVKNGFGIFNSFFNTIAEGGMDNITVDGYGIRSTDFRGGGDIASITARGNGARLNALNYTSSVRYSERGRFSPFSGYNLSELNDLHLYLGTSAAAPVRTVGDYGRSGIIDLVTAVGSGNLGSVSGHQIKSTALAFGAGTDSVVSRDYIDTLEIRSGRLNFLQSRQDVSWADWRIAGPVGTVRIGGTFRGTSVLAAEGPNGQIGSFSTGRALYGAVISSNNLNELIVGTDFGSIGSFNTEEFGGERLSAGIDVAGDLGSMRVGGSVLTGSTTWVGDRIDLLAVDGEMQDDSRIDTRRLGTLKIVGGINGDLIVRQP